jgi:hypothetical protein
VAVGPIRVVLEGPADGADFELPVFNSLNTRVDATLLALEGGGSPLRSETTGRIAPGTWAEIPFSISPNCDSRGRRPVPLVKLGLRTSDDRVEQSLPLPEEGKVLLDYHEAFCASGPTIRPSQLHGVWMVEDVYGPDTYLAGVHLMRFGRDGSFVADPEGGLDTDDVGVRGRYRLVNELLDIDVEGGYGCDSPAHVTWRVSLNENDNQLMSMVWIRGDCPDGAPGDVWVVRRVLQAAGVPKEP